jgi:hypothetical protein
MNHSHAVGSVDTIISPHNVWRTLPFAAAEEPRHALERGTSDGLAALRTLMLNGGWDQYWQQHEVLPLLAT